MTDIKVGVSGLGYFGSKHAQELLDMNVNVVGVYDTDTAHAAHIAEELGVCRFSEYAELLVHCDALVIATPPATHKQLVVDAAAAGVHVYCEKPIAETVEEAEAMIEAAENASVTFMVGHQMRFSSAYEDGRSLIAAGVLGEIHFMEMNATWEYGDVDVPTSGWRSENSHFFESGIHQVDILNWYFGLPTEVKAVSMPFSATQHWERNLIATLGYPSGVIGLLRWGETRVKANRDFVIHGQKGTLTISLDEEALCLIGGEQLPTMPIGPQGSRERKALAHFLDNVVSQTPPRVTGRVAKEALEVTLKIIANANGGENV